MQFNFSWDASVSSAPAAFKAAVLAAGQQFATYFADNITVNLNVGWGEAGGAAVTSPVAAGSFVQSPTTYDDFAANLAAVAASGDDQSTVGALNYLSVSGGAAPFNVANAQSKAFGLIAPTATAADGSIGFSAGVTWDFDPSNGISVGAYDFFAAFAHAASHAMGRVNDGANDPLSLFSFTASGTPAAANATNAYLSMDGGVTKLASFLSSGDLSDFSLPGADA